MFESDHHLGYTRLLVGVGDVDLELAEALAEIGELPGCQLLPRKAHDAPLAEGTQHRVELRLRKRFREIEALDRRAQGLSAVGHFHHTFLISTLPPVEGRCRVPSNRRN